jgi:hypothetical protein
MGNDFITLNSAKKRQESREAVGKYTAAVAREDVPPELYRADLFRKIKAQRYGERGSLTLTEIAADCELSINTVKGILDGNGSKIESIFRIARYFGVPWLAVFDVGKRFTLGQRSDGTGFDILSGALDGKGKQK